MSCTFGRFSVAMVTPFHDDGSMDYESARRLAKHLVAGGCDAIVVSGTTGEAPATHMDEKAELLEEVRQAVGSEIKLIAGVSSNDTAHTLAMARVATQVQANGLLVTAPYYNRPSQDGIFEHFKAVHEESDLPILIYDIPGRTGVTIEDGTLDRLAELERIQGVKDATGNVAAGISRMRRTGLEWYSGDDGLNFFFMCGGASGVISVVGHVEGKRISAMLDAIEAGDLAQARALDAELAASNRGIMGAGQGATYAKQAVYALGLIESPRSRLPLVEPSESEITSIREILTSQGLLK
ncbi:MAG: 4-hydroxy-tetrahydrodipicolinate synthase [Mobiluncus porci]|uniref:4-hydroxy-tetrahydrodipicolinate synthase n=1 Tax=Mobiluncus TaxID=2050 RepID=UPI0023EFD47F|nr:MULTISPECIES: 4-hydroxy-tetrahydrodipicolinate synthase [Mobiluncus]MCI6584491.1 4-hydroxy-tetrahydrodipicolinate synthase [Mobiluncus sp.]MDD7540801.1 4-hydroxy-tetrahydrodipicolinate synthase [Mobiluncus porci]MDY5747936.1 4-hydroxy-tetrahydrodipicolinate synthase [Mobiluncus porci]